jgi:hypothetical protein
VSTVDPGIARAKRAARRPSVLRLVILLILLLAGGALLGAGWGSFGRLNDSGEPPVAAIIGINGGLLITIVAFIGWSFAVSKRSDIGFAYGFAAVLFGGGCGLLVAAQGGTDDVAAWVAWGLVVFGALFLVLGFSAATARRRQVARDERTTHDGTLATATVTDKGYDFFRESPRIFTTITVTFTDLQGVQRWVQKPALIEQSDPIVDGQETRLWYDPQNPGDTRRIVVELAQERPLRR